MIQRVGIPADSALPCAISGGAEALQPALKRLNTRCIITPATRAALLAVFEGYWKDPVNRLELRPM
jgi:hypothetical protein